MSLLFFVLFCFLQFIAILLNESNNLFKKKEEEILLTPYFEY